MAAAASIEVSDAGNNLGIGFDAQIPVYGRSPSPLSTRSERIRVPHYQCEKFEHFTHLMRTSAYLAWAG
jgi:hypothetical protein